MPSLWPTNADYCTTECWKWHEWTNVKQYKQIFVAETFANFIQTWNSRKFPARETFLFYSMWANREAVSFFGPPSIVLLSVQAVYDTWLCWCCADIWQRISHIWGSEVAFSVRSIFIFLVAWINVSKLRHRRVSSDRLRTLPCTYFLD